MRRPAFAALVLLAACAAPVIRLAPRFAPGETRTYRLSTDATTRIDVPGAERTERTRLVARSVIEIVSVREGSATVRLTISPERFSRNGRTEDPPPQQRAELVLSADGAVREVVSVEGVTAGEGLEVQDLAPVLGSALPARRVRLGEVWTATTQAPGSPSARGEQRGRVAGLETVRGEDCVMLSVGTRRPLTRQRSLGERTVSLTGIEHAHSRIAYAIRRGLPVEITTESTADLEVSAATGRAGSVTIETTTTLGLV